MEVVIGICAKEALMVKKKEFRIDLPAVGDITPALYELEDQVNQWVSDQNGRISDFIIFPSDCPYGQYALTLLYIELFGESQILQC